MNTLNWVKSYLGHHARIVTLLSALFCGSIASHGNIVTSTSPGVAWSPFTVDSMNPSSDLTISVFNSGLGQWEPSTLFTFSYSGTSDFGAMDKLNATAATTALADQVTAPSVAWRGADQSGNQGVSSLVQGTLVNSGQDWASVTPDYPSIVTSFGNMALLIPTEITGSDPQIEGYFYNQSDPVYMGFRFKLAELDSDYRYGWIAITSIGATTLNINSWAYNDQFGQDIAAGAVPEPVTISVIFAFIALGCAGYRRLCSRK